MKKQHLLVTAMLLTSCHRMSDSLSTSGPGAAAKGRYQGVGLYAPGPLLRHLIGAPASRDGAAAALADDDNVIVVVDTTTGELRQCGNMSGVCTTLQPWQGTPLPSPSRLDKHAVELEQEDRVTRAQRVSG